MNLTVPILMYSLKFKLQVRVSEDVYIDLIIIIIPVQPKQWHFA